MITEMMVHRCRMYSGRDQQRMKLIRLDSHEQRVKAVYFRDDPAVIRQCAECNVFPFNVRELPSYTAWQACRTDLLARPWQAVWWLQNAGRQTVMTFGRSIGDYPAYWTLPAGSRNINGMGHPQPIFRFDQCYKETPNGIAYAGYGVPVHEEGHYLDSMLGTGGAWFSQTQWWAKVHAAIRWPAPGHKDKGEAFADSWAMWNLSRQQDGWRRLPQDVDTKIYDFWYEITPLMGWRLGDPPPDYYQSKRTRWIERGLRKGLQAFRTEIERRTEKC